MVTVFVPAGEAGKRLAGTGGLAGAAAVDVSALLRVKHDGGVGVVLPVRCTWRHSYRARNAQPH